MSTLRDILDTVGNLRGEVTDYISSTKQMKSLSKASQEGVMNFPVIVSDALTIEDASLVAKALEKEYASFALVVMTMNPYLNVDGANASAVDYVNKFHQNVDTRTDATDIINTIQKITNEASELLDLDYNAADNLEQVLLYKVYENVNYGNMNKKNIAYSYTIEDVTESKILNDVVKRRINSIYKPVYEAETTPTKIEVNIKAGNSTSAFKQSSDSGKNQRQLQHLMDNDVKKSNELVPTLLHVRIYPVDKDSAKELPPIDFVVGIKATLHPVPSDEMITNICRGVKNEDVLFNMLRWTTGEISFLKDFVFGINEIKIDAMNASHKSSKWWTMLKRRKAMAKIKNFVFPNKLLPNATIVITQEEVNTIKEVYGYDLENLSIIDKLMSNYFLIAFVIVDPALQRVKFLFDGRTQFEMQTYATLARESTTNDKHFKEMLNMLGRRI